MFCKEGKGVTHWRQMTITGKTPSSPGYNTDEKFPELHLKVAIRNMAELTANTAKQMKTITCESSSKLRFKRERGSVGESGTPLCKLEKCLLEDADDNVVAAEETVL